MKKNWLWAFFTIPLFLIIFYISLQYISLIVTSIFLYYISRPIFRIVYNKTEMRRVSALVAVLSFVIPISLISLYSIYFGFLQLISFTRTEEFSSIEPLMRNSITDFIGESQNITTSSLEITNSSNQGFYSFLLETLDPIIQSASLVTSLIISILIVLTLTYYLLKDGGNMRNWFEKWIVEDRISYTQGFFKYVDNELSSIFVGNILAAIIIAAMTIVIYLGLNIFLLPSKVNVPYPVLVGILCGLTSIVPILGMKLVYLPLTGYMTFVAYTNGFFEFIWSPLIVLLISSIIIDIIPEMIIRPYISSRNTHLGILILAYIIGPIFFGWYGLFLGPIMVVLATGFIKLVIPEIMSHEG